jgi:SAM-dependent methyltransferase
MCEKRPSHYTPLERAQFVNLRQLSGEEDIRLPSGRVIFKEWALSSGPKHSSDKIEIAKRVQHIQQTSAGRYPWHDEFFENHGNEIRVFADVGCGLSRGAPTTLDARRLLPNSRILATDVEGDFNSQALKDHNVGVIEHSIVDGPLPVKADVIRFANVACYLSPSERDRAIRNLHRSLRRGGLLMNEHCLFRRTRKGFELAAIYAGRVVIV